MAQIVKYVPISEFTASSLNFTKTAYNKKTSKPVSYINYDYNDGEKESTPTIILNDFLVSGGGIIISADPKYPTSKDGFTISYDTKQEALTEIKTKLGDIDELCKKQKPQFVRVLIPEAEINSKINEVMEILNGKTKEDIEDEDSFIKDCFGKKPEEIKEKCVKELMKTYKYSPIIKQPKTLKTTVKGKEYDCYATTKVTFPIVYPERKEGEEFVKSTSKPNFSLVVEDETELVKSTDHMGKTIKKPKRHICTSIEEVKRLIPYYTKIRMVISFNSMYFVNSQYGIVITCNQIIIVEKPQKTSFNQNVINEYSFSKKITYVEDDEDDNVNETKEEKKIVKQQQTPIKKPKRSTEKVSDSDSDDSDDSDKKHKSKKDKSKKKVEEEIIEEVKTKSSKSKKHNKADKVDEDVEEEEVIDVKTKSSKSKKHNKVDEEEPVIVEPVKKVESVKKVAEPVKKVEDNLLNEASDSASDDDEKSESELVESDELSNADSDSD